MRVLFWRVIYGIADSEFLINNLALIISIAQRLRGETFAQRLTYALARLLTCAFRRPPEGWVNLHRSRLYWRLQRRAAGARPVPGKTPRPPTGRPLRVGVFGYFAGLLNFPKTLFEGFPAEAELHAFDVQFLYQGSGYRAEWLRAMTTQYTPVVLERVAQSDAPLLEGWAGTGYQPILVEPDVSYRDLLGRAATAINQADLDLLMVVSYKRYAYDLLDLIETPCIVQACTGSDVLHHDKVSFYLYPQPEAGYSGKGRRLFCAATQAPLIPQAIYPGFLYYDPRGLDLDSPLASWAQRDPLIVFHGRLYKLAAMPTLDCIINLLQEDSALEFVLMGQDDGQAAQIQSAARQRGVATRVHYLGCLLVGWDVTGNAMSMDWHRLASYLKRARLAPDPFPVGGGQARVEAYATGAPVVHMGVRFNLKRGWLGQESLADAPALLVPSGTAYSREEYMALCRRCLYDEPFADRLAAEQLAVARKVCDAPAFWQQLIDCYRDWLGTYQRVERYV